MLWSELEKHDIMTVNVDINVLGSGSYRLVFPNVPNFILAL
jgi:hypothetical protein